MEIVEILSKGLSPNEYHFLNCINDKNEYILSLLIGNIGKESTTCLITHLVELGFLEINNNDENDLALTANSFTLTDYCREVVFPSKKDLFKELVATYPRSTPSGRVLRSYSKMLQKRYLKSIDSDEEKHLLVLQCIEAELEDRAKTGQLNFMYGLSTYINNRHWEVYLEEVIKKKEKKDRGEPKEEESPRFKIFK